MNIDLGKVMMMTMSTMGIIATADTNHDGKYSVQEIANAAKAELQVGLGAYPEIAARVHSDPQRLNDAADLIAQAIAKLTAPPAVPA